MSVPNPFAQLPSLPTTVSQAVGQAAYDAFKLAYSISPIILTNGIATAFGGALPIVALTQGLNTLQSVIQNASAFGTLDGFFAQFVNLPGGTLLQYQVATYPLANQAVAANAIIAQPLSISVLMRCPAGSNTGGFPLKLVTMTALQNTLQQHNIRGGTYSVLTPSFIYTNCVMTSLRDVSGDGSRQVQYDWQLDFYQPLVTIASANTSGAFLNGLLQKFADGTPVQGGTPSWSNMGLGVGNPFSLLTNSLVPPGALQ